ncbi:MAG: tetratricopeptide repeat protein, partial [Cyanobacteria bacterium J083]
MVQVSADSYNEEGKKLIGRGKFAKAIELFQQAINLEPSYIKAYNNLGAAFKLQNKLKEAEVAYRQAISIQPNYAKAYYNLGVVLKQQQKLSEAEVAYRQAIVCQADFWQAKLELATLLGQQQRLTESESLYLQLTQLKPNYAGIYAQLGSVLYQQNKSCRAVQCYERAIALEPDNASYYNNLGLIFEAQQDRERATLYFEQALRLEPNLAASIQNLGLLSAKQGDNLKAIKLLRQAVEQNPQSHDLHSSLIFMLSNTEGITSEEILQEAKTWCDRHVISAGLKPMSHDNELSSQRRLKIGYVSPDFRRHSVSYFMQPLLASHNRDQVEVFCYSNMPRENEDEVTETIQTLTDHWRNIAQMNPYQVAQQIQADKIDILVDLAGHTKGNSLIAFGLKMAPIQATYLGYYGTTGLSTIDYWITDQVLHPADTKEQSVEQIWRLPRCYVTYQPLADSPQVKPSPVLTNKFVTFGSFNNISKLSDTTIQLWAKILRAVPNARLLLKSLFIQDIDKQSSILAKFAEYGLEKQRIKFCPRQSLIKHLAMYGEIDICLDPFPYNGCTSTCEAMWMGVPVLTLAGERKISRMGSSLLTAVGLTDWIADNKEEYIAKAQEFASKPQKLNDLRQSLRTKFQNSSLFDSQGLAEAMDASYRRMWLKYLEEKIDSTHREVNQRNKVNSDSIQD